jgi:mRNA-degrading endonuclease RelE of RelBE toxin-antitoxin system
MIVIPKKLFNKEIEGIPQNYRIRIAALVTIMRNAQSLDEIDFIEKLSGYKTFYKIRIGYLRIGIEIDKQDIIYLITVKKRGDIYKHFP